MNLDIKDDEDELPRAMETQPFSSDKKFVCNSYGEIKMEWNIKFEFLEETKYCKLVSTPFDLPPSLFVKQSILLM